jgi:hypothetical protein
MARVSIILALVLAGLAPDAFAVRSVPQPRAAIDALLDRFVPEVLERKDVAAGARLVGGYVTVESVQPYPAKGTHFHGWRLNYSYPGDVGFDLLLQPRKKSLGPWSFRGEAQRIGGRWRITNWYPVATFAPAGKPARVVGPNDFQPGIADTHGEGLSGRWVLAPVALAGALALASLAVAGVRLVRTRARVRAIERALGTRRA